MTVTSDATPQPGGDKPRESDQLKRQDPIWEYFQNEAPQRFGAAEPRLRFLVRMLKPGQNVLNIGSGSGLFEAIAASAGIRIHALDPIARTIEALRERLGLQDRARVGYAHQIPFDGNYFDAVVASEIMEHLPDEIMAASLAEVSRVLVPGGILLGTVPSRERLEDQVVVCPNCSIQFHRWGHIRSFTKESLRCVLGSKFSVILLQERVFISWKHLNWKGRITGVLKILLTQIGIHGTNENLVFVARKP